MNPLLAWHWLQRTVREWSATDGPVLLHVVKILLAGGLALWLSMLLDLEQPRTALITVGIVMQTHAGLVLSKSFYRMIGTVAGILFSLLLVALFIQDRMLFLFGAAVWIGLCTAGSVVLRDNQSYAFVLAGYTLCIVGLPASLDPDQTFAIATNRLSEILIGLLCATLVSELVFPRRLTGMIRQAVRKRFADFSELLDSSLNGHGNHRIALARLMSDVFRLESFRAASAMESDRSRSLRLKLGELNLEFMEVTTTFHAFEELLRRLRQKNLQATADHLMQIARGLLEAALPDGHSAHHESEAGQVADRLQTWLAETGHMPTDITSAGTSQTDLETGLSLLRQLASEWRDYARSYASLAGSAPGAEAPALGVRFDPVTVGLAGLRGALMLGIMSVVWILTAWPSGIEAITLGVVASTLFATSPTPARTVRQFLTGGLAGAILSWWTSFWLLPQAQDFTTLMLAITPGIAIAGALTAKPERAVTGAGLFMIWLMHLGIGPAYMQNPAAFINDLLADFLGIICAAMLYELIDLQGSRWSQERTIRALRNLVSDVCRSTTPFQRETLETGTRDLVYRSGSLRRITGPGDDRVIDWLLMALETGHQIIALRELLIEEPDVSVHKQFGQVTGDMARLFDMPAPEARSRAESSLQDLLQILEQHSSANCQRARFHVHLLQNALADKTSVLQFATGER